MVTIFLYLREKDLLKDVVIARIKDYHLNVNFVGTG